MEIAHHEPESEFIAISIITINIIISNHAHTSLSAAFCVCKPAAALLLLSERGACSAPPPACRRTSMAYILPSASKLSCVPCSTMRPASMTIVWSADRTVDNLQRAHDWVRPYGSCIFSACHICFLHGSSQSVCLWNAFERHFDVIYLMGQP